MTDKPIIFSGPMVRALLDGRKTQARRLFKGAVEGFESCEWNGEGWDVTGLIAQNKVRALVPRVKPGDHLWVRENWSGEHVFRNTKPSEREDIAWKGAPYDRDCIWYWADGSPNWGDWEKPRPSIHMPRWASRITLKVTDVRVQRLQDISDTDAQAEGCEGDINMHRQMNLFGVRGAEFERMKLMTCKWQFETLWNSINGPDAWAENPWVVAYTFQVLTSAMGENKDG